MKGQQQQQGAHGTAQETKSPMTPEAAARVQAADAKAGSGGVEAGGFAARAQAAAAKNIPTPAQQQPQQSQQAPQPQQPQQAPRGLLDYQPASDVDELARELLPMTYGQGY